MFLAVIELAGVPVVVSFAWYNWLRSGREHLSAWRNGLGLTALLLVSVSWGLGALTMFPRYPHRPIIDFWWSSWLVQPLALVAAMLAIALKGVPRLLALLAGLLLLGFWVPFIYV